MATIKNIIDTTAKTKGFGKATKDVEQLDNATKTAGKNQTRLGHTAVSAGRQFSSQAQGLGGLVAVYAGAAATTFALQQAFSALEKSARAEQVIQGVNALAAAVGESGDRIITKVQQIIEGQLNLVATAQNVNIALSAGFSSDQIEKLAGVANKASRALGRNLSDALERILRGTAKLEPELLDELGIFTRIEPAVQAYATKLGVTAASLTDFQRRQAFVNATIQEGQEKFSSVDTSVKSTNVTLQQFLANLGNVALSVGGFIANGLQPLIAFFTQGIGIYLAFGAVSTLVTGKLVEVSANFAKAKIASAAATRQETLDLKANAAAQLKAASTASGTIDSKLVRGTTQGLNPFIKRTAAELKVSNTKELGVLRTKLDLTGRLNMLESHRIKALLKGQIASISNINAENDKRFFAGKLAGKDLALHDKRVLAEKAYRAELVATNAVLKSRGIASRAAGAANIGKRVAGAALSGASKVIGVVSIVGIVVTIVASLAQFVASILGVTEELHNMVSAAGTWIATLFGVNKEAKARRRAEAVLEKAGSTFGAGFSHNMGPGSFGRNKTVDLNEKQLHSLLGEEITKEELVRQIAIQIGGLQSRQIQQLADVLEAKFTLAGDGVTKARSGALASLSEASGQSESTIAKAFSFSRTGVASTTRQPGLSPFSAQITPIEDRKSLLTVERAISDSRDRAAIGAKLQSELMSDLLNKNLRAGNISQRLIAIDNVRLELGKMIGQTGSKEIDNLLILLDIRKDEIIVLADRQIALQQTNDILKKTFATEFANADKLSGLLSKDLKLASSKKEVRANQINYLRDILLIQEKSANITSLHNDSLKIGIGLLLGTIIELKKINEILEKQTLKVQIEIVKIESDIKIDALKKQLALTKEIGNANSIRLAQETTQAKRLLDILKTTQAFNEKTLSNANSARSNRMTGTLSPFFSDSSRNQEGVRANQSELTQLQSNKAGLVALMVEIEKSRVAEAAEKLAQFDREAAENKKLGLAEVAKVAMLQKIKKDEDDFELALIKERLGIVGEEAKVFNRFLIRLEEVLLTHSAGQEFALDGQGLGKKEFVSNFIKDNKIKGTLDSEIEGRNIEALARLDKLQDERKTLSALVIARANANRVADIGIVAQERLNLLATQANDSENAKADLAAEILAIDREIALKQQEVTAVRQLANINNDIWLKTLANVTTTIKDGIGKGLTELNAAFVEGTLTMDNFKEGLKDFARTMVQDIQKTVFQATVVDPVKDFVGEQIGSLFGIDIVKPDGSAAKPFYVKDADKAAGGLLAGDPTDLASKTEGLCKEVGKFTGEDGATGGFFEKVKDQFSKLGDGIMDIFSGVGDVLGDLFSGISTMFSGGGGGGGLGSLFSGFGGLFSGGASGAGSLGSLFGGGAMSSASSAAGFFGTSIGGLGAGLYLANGGTVPHMATGGKSLRDRHAAMLEPGEFVLRKHAAKSIGTNALNNMNALGASGMRGNNVSINVTNNGTAQETEGQPKIRFDGNQMVVDIILTDIRNNGPISQGMRGNA